jgi:peptidoglycan hydrolase-like protein with peptidoglycan-binding domain
MSIVLDAAKFLPYVFRAISNMDRISALLTKLSPLLPEALALYNKAIVLVPETVDLINTIAPGVLPLATSATPDVIPEPLPEGFTMDWVQQSLNQLMGASLVVDGLYGPKTHEALMSYQKSRGLTVDGWAGPLTCAKLFSEVKPSG